MILYHKQYYFGNYYKEDKEVKTKVDKVTKSSSPN